MHKYIAIEGNIGTGKTSLALKLAHRFGYNTVLEEFEENPYLPSFYSNPQKYAFQLELSFLADRYQQLTKEQIGTDLFKPVTISDYLFSKSLVFANVNLEESDLFIFRKLFSISENLIPKPDLIVFLHKNIENLQRNISKRGRHYEQQIENEYLVEIGKAYLQHFNQISLDIPILLIDTNSIDFVSSTKDFDFISELVQKSYSNGIHNIAYNAEN